MNHRLVALSVASLALLAPLTVPAQGLRPSTATVGAGVLAPARIPTATGLAADYIVAVVNPEPITNNEVRAALQRVQQQLAQQGNPQVDNKTLARQVLE